MKQSDLKEYIKEEIISVLSEESAEEINNKTKAQGEFNDELEKTKELVNEYENISLADIEEMGYEAGEIIFAEIRDKFQNNPDFKAYFEGLKQGFLDNLGSYDLNEDIDDGDEADKSASKGAKGKDAINLSKKSDEDLKKQTMKQKVSDFTAEMVKKGIVDDNGKILDTPKYVKEFAKFKSKKK